MASSRKSESAIREMEVQRNASLMPGSAEGDAQRRRWALLVLCIAPVSHLTADTAPGAPETEPEFDSRLCPRSHLSTREPEQTVGESVFLPFSSWLTLPLPPYTSNPFPASASPRSPAQTEGLGFPGEWDSITSFCKGPGSKYFQFCRRFGLSPLNPALAGLKRPQAIWKSMGPAVCQQNFTEMILLLLRRSGCLTLCNPMAAARQAPLSMGFSRQENWSGLPFPSPADPPDPGIEPTSPALTGGFSTTEPPGKTPYGDVCIHIAGSHSSTAGTNATLQTIRLQFLKTKPLGKLKSEFQELPGDPVDPGLSLPRGQVQSLARS